MLKSVFGWHFLVEISRIPGGGGFKYVFFWVLPLLLGSDTLPKTKRTAKAPENRPGPKKVTSVFQSHAFTNGFLPPRMVAFWFREMPGHVEANLQPPKINGWTPENDGLDLEDDFSF